MNDKSCDECNGTGRTGCDRDGNECQSSDCRVCGDCGGSGKAVDGARRRVSELRAKFSAYDGGDRPMSPPVRLMRELAEAEAELSRLA